MSSIVLDKLDQELQNRGHLFLRYADDVKCDRLTKAKASQTIHSNIPGSKLISLAAVGHMGVMEQHEEVNNAVRDFLRS